MNTKELIALKMSEKENEIERINNAIDLLNIEISELDKQKDLLINERNPLLLEQDALKEEYKKLECALSVVEEVEPIGQEEENYGME